jgi:hypothetical protein
MTTACEKCTMDTKVEFCCGSNPVTGKTKLMMSNETGEIFSVCNRLAADGSCKIYDRRPEACKAYACEEVYAMGLNSQDK